jgi:hypothetical protein
MARWKQGRLTELRVQSDHAAQYQVLYAGNQTQLKLKPGRTALLDASLHTPSQQRH